MPVYTTPKYEPSFYFRNAHWSTIYPALFRKVPMLEYERQRIDTPDDDFLDLDFLKCGSDTIAVLCHGLEGDSRRPYIRAMAQQMNSINIDVVAYNYRGCSETPNKQLKMYHSGATDDLNSVVEYAISLNYKKVILIGFSLGANLILKYLGEIKDANNYVKKAIAIAPPCDLHAASSQISKIQNWPYFKRFLISLKKKVLMKSKAFSQIDPNELKKVRSIKQFDDLYTAPLHGFKDANDYYSRCQSKSFIKDIHVDTLIISAENDPLLPKECIPYEEAAENSNVNLLVTQYGGHTGYPLNSDVFWHEQVTVDFLTGNIFSDISEN